MTEYEFIQKVSELTEEMTSGIECMDIETKARVFEVYASSMNEIIKGWSDEE